MRHFKDARVNPIMLKEPRIGVPAFAAKPTWQQHLQVLSTQVDFCGGTLALGILLCAARHVHGLVRTREAAVIAAIAALEVMVPAANTDPVAAAKVGAALGRVFSNTHSEIGLMRE